MDTLISYTSYYAGYKMINTSNIFNFLLISLQRLDESERKTFIQNMVLILGRSFVEQFKNYIFSKLPKSELLDLF